MKFLFTTFPFVLAASGLFTSSAVADVWKVGGPNSDAATVAAAVQLASDGDVILVYNAGTPGFSVQGKSLQILPSAANASIQIQGSILISNLSPTQAVELTGMRVTHNGFGSALTASNCAGSIRIDNCNFKTTSTSAPVSVAAVSISDCEDVAATNSSFTGADGEWGLSDPWVGDGGDGHNAVRIHDSNVALYRCSAVGGVGGDATHPGTFLPGYGGEGGHALKVSGSRDVFVSLCALQGGEGGFDDYVLSFGMGFPGYGIDNTSNSGVSTQSIESYISDVGPGGTSTHTALGGSAVRISGPAWLYDDEHVEITVHGPQNARVGLFFSTGYDHAVSLGGGPLLIDIHTGPNAQMGLFLGKLDASGQLAYQTPLRDLAHFTHVKLHVTGIVIAPGSRQYTNSISPVVLDRAW